MSASWNFAALSDEERAMLLSIFRRLQALHDEISNLRISIDNMKTPAEESRHARTLGDLMQRLSADINGCDQRLAAGSLDPLEAENWVPVIESVHNYLKQSLNTLSRSRGAQLESALAKLRKALAAGVGLPFDYKK
jgi:hypothetical protein